MQILVKRIEKDLPLPEYKTDGSVCFDLMARETIEIPPRTVKLIPLNVIITVPKGYMFILASRSSTLLKKGLITGNGIGIIDQDYHGPSDEVKYQVYNLTENPVTVSRGERIVQGCFIPVEKVSFTEADILTAKNRGGFGSTG